MRDHKKLRAFDLAHSLVLDVYRLTRSFPKEETYGLTSQIRRSAVSVTSNIVEGCARPTERDYAHFLSISYASACELQYQLKLSGELGFIPETDAATIHRSAESVAKILSALIQALRAECLAP